MTQKTGSPKQLRYVGDLDERTGKVRISREALRFIYDAWKRTGGHTDAVEAATESTYYGIGSPPTYVWRSDPSGVFPASDPSTDLTLTFFDPDGNQIAERTLRGTLESSSGEITVTNVSSTGLETTYALYGDGSDSVRADVSVTLSSGKTIQSSLTWNAVDNSQAGGTPFSLSGSGGVGSGGGGGTK